jgi:ATP-dependent RNA helicase RhlE
MRCGWTRSKRWCSTKPIACWTWAFPPSANACWPCCPRSGQNLLFSATFPPEVQALADGLLHEAVRVEAAAAGARGEPAIVQRVIAVDTPRRTELLRTWCKRRLARVLVFVATRYATEHVARKLHDRGVPAAALHGEMSQGARTDVLEDFKDGRWKTCW